MALRFFEDTVASKSSIEAAIKKYGWTAEHNYHWYQYYRRYYDPPNVNVFVEGDHGALFTAYDPDERVYFVVFDPMASVEYQAALLAEYIDWVFSYTDGVKVCLQLELPMRKQLIHTLPSKYRCCRIYYTLIWPVYNLDTFDPALPGGNFKTLRKEMHKFYREHQVEIKDAKTFDDKESLHGIVEDWGRKRDPHDHAMMGVYQEMIKGNFAGTDEARVFIVDGKAVGFNAGWMIPNRNRFYGSVGIHNYSLDDLGTMLYLEDMIWLKNHGYHEVDMGGTEKASLPFKKKFGPTSFYKSAIFSVVKNEK